MPKPPQSNPAVEQMANAHKLQIDALQAQLQQAIAAATKAATTAAAAASDKPEPTPPTLPPTPPTPPPTLPNGLPPGWRMAKDMRGRIYYFNKSLNLSQYDLPEPESPPLPPPPTPKSALPDCSRPSQTSRGSTSSAVASQPWEVDERRNRITRIRGILEYCDNRQDKAELNGELAVLLRQESVYMQSRENPLRRATPICRLHTTIVEHVSNMEIL